MTHTEQENKTQDKKVKQDTVAVTSFVAGFISIFFSFVGAIPIAAIILGICGINRTKASGSGRWMAVAGLILGIVFLFSNAYMHGHLDFLNINTETSSSTLRETNDLTVRLLEIERVSDEEFLISAEITNASNKPIRALKGTVYVDNIFDEYVTGIKFVRTDTLQQGDKFTVSDEVLNLHSSDTHLDGYQDLEEAGSIKNLKVEIYVEELIFSTGEVTEKKNDEATAQPTQTKAQPKPMPTWHYITSFEGVGMKKLPPFIIQGNEWRIKWSCSTTEGQFGLSVTGHSVTGGDTGTEIVRTSCPFSGTTKYEPFLSSSGPGSFYLDILADQYIENQPGWATSWNITVEELR